MAADIRLMRLGGRCADGFERGAGILIHAVRSDSNTALCGATHGRRSAGWFLADGTFGTATVPTCPRCARKLAKGAGNAAPTRSNALLTPPAAVDAVAAIPPTASRTAAPTASEEAVEHVRRLAADADRYEQLVREAVDIVEGGGEVDARDWLKAALTALRSRAALALAVAVLLLPCPARANEAPLLAAIAAANVADLVTTHRALASGAGVEGNPIMRQPAAAIGLKAGATLAEVVAVRALWRSGRKRAALAVGLGIAAGTGLVAVHNARIAAGGR